MEIWWTRRCHLENVDARQIRHMFSRLLFSTKPTYFFIPCLVYISVTHGEASFARLVYPRYHSRVTRQFRPLLWRTVSQRDTTWKIFFCMNRELRWETLPLPLIWLPENQRIPSSVVVARPSCEKRKAAFLHGRRGVARVIYSLNK